MNNTDNTQKGISLLFFSYSLWGILPLFWHFLNKSTALQTLSHRIFWSFILIILILAFQKKLPIFFTYFKQPKIIGFYAITGSLLVINWLIFIWAVGDGRVIESSLGYFILPLISVLLGVIFLKEKLRIFQWLLLGVAASGIIYLGGQVGKVPWVSLSLAITFGIYSLMKKKAPTDADFSIAFEMTTIVLPAIAYLFYSHWSGIGIYGNVDTQTNLMLMTTSLITIIPVLAYSIAVPLIPLSLSGLLFYINPTLQFIVGAFILHEPFNQTQLIGYSFIWLALILYFLEGWHSKKKKQN